MSVKETDVFVHRPLASFERYFRASGQAIKVKAGDDVALLFGGGDIATAACGLLAIDEDGEWVQVLHDAPEDVDALAAFLAAFDIRPAELDVMQDWDGNRLFDIDKLIGALIALEERDELKSGMEF